MPYDPPPVWRVRCPDGSTTAKRAISPSQAALQIASRLGIPGIYSVRRVEYRCFQLPSGHWAAEIVAPAPVP